MNQSNPHNNAPYTPSSPDETGRPVVMGHPRSAGTPKNEGWPAIVSTIAVLLTAPLVALLLTMFVFQSYQVDGPSMEPTLYHEDRLLVWKLPRTWARITHQTYIPNRGDIIIFTESKLESFGQSADKQLIKRVIGLAGERVVVKDGTITVYNHDSPTGFHPDDLMPYGKTIPTTSHETDVTIPDGQLFVVGDNRLESLDSRYFGPIELKNIVGKLSYRVLPLNKAEGF